MDWLVGLAEGLDTAALSPREEQELLSVAREVAHRVERRITPLAAFLIGAAVGEREATGRSRAEALREALEIVSARLPAEEQP
jgi:hypothetical protein